MHPLLVRLRRSLPVDAAVDLLLPSDCVHCRRPLRDPRHVHGLCLACWGRLEPVPEDACRVCGLTPDPGTGPGAAVRCRTCVLRPWGISRLDAAVLYRGPARSLVLRAKSGRRPEILRALGRWLVPLVDGPIGRADVVVVPVPTAPVRAWVRGFDPARELAVPLARALGLRCAPAALRRRPWSLAAMKGLPAHRREAALAGGLYARGRDVAGREVLLVDDVVTTGSTVRECARTLRRAGARRVRVACWARTPV